MNYYGNKLLKFKKERKRAKERKKMVELAKYRFQKFSMNIKRIF